MVVFVIGPSCAGKSTYIEKNFPNYKKVDLYNFQKERMSLMEIYESYEKCASALKEAVLNNENVVLEHTLLKANRRKQYIDIVKENTGKYPEVVCIVPKFQTLRERNKKRNAGISSSSLLEMLQIFDIPKVEDGFSKITIIED